MIFLEKCIREVGNALNAEKKLQNFLLNLLQIDQSIVEIATENVIVLDSEVEKISVDKKSSLNSPFVEGGTKGRIFY